MTKRELANARVVDAQHRDAQHIDARHIDEFAETQVLMDKPGKRPAVEDDATAQSVYSEYVQEIERMLKAEKPK